MAYRWRDGSRDAAPGAPADQYAVYRAQGALPWRFARGSRDRKEAERGCKRVGDRRTRAASPPRLSRDRPLIGGVVPLSPWGTPGGRVVT